MKRMSFILSILILVLVSTSIQAQIPRIINYQGLLWGSNEQPVPEGNYKITFSLYEEDGTKLWTEVHDPVFIRGGMIHVHLGVTQPLNLPFDHQYFLGIQVGNDPELQPRMLLTPAPYSFRAEEANTVGGLRASKVPEPHVLFPLGSDGKFPASVLPTNGPSGDYLKKNEPDVSEGNFPNPMLRISNLGNGQGVIGRSNNNDGVVGWAGANNKSGVFGHSTSGLGVLGRSDNNDGVVGWTGAGNKSGVYGYSTDGIAVTGRSTNNYGVLAKSDNSHSLYIPGSGAAGVKVESAAHNGIDVVSANHEGVLVRSAGRDGVMVGNANWSGVYVANANYDALRVQRAGQDGLRIFDTIGRYYIKLGSDTNPRFIFSKGGAAHADSGWFGPADFAELIEVDGSVASYEPGDVLVISNDKDKSVTLSSHPNSTSIIGVYSTKPGFIGSTHPMKGKYDNEIPVAITGIVPCKVSTENGPIKRGDLLTTSSTPGYAMKASDPKVGTILGKAMQSLENGMDKIEVLIILQ